MVPLRRCRCQQKILLCAMVALFALTGDAQAHRSVLQRGSVAGGDGDATLDNQAYSLGFRSADLAEEAAGLQARSRPSPEHGGPASAAGAGKYWEQPSDGSEYSCAFNASGRAEVVAPGDRDSRQPSARNCAQACRAHANCTAWFWCKDAQRRACFDVQSESWVPHHDCALLRLPVLPTAPPDAAALDDTGGPDLHRSFAAGYTKRGLYMRPPDVVIATAMWPCGHATGNGSRRAKPSRLDWLSVQNKMDFARLHGTTFHLVAVTDPKTSKAEAMRQLLAELAGDTGAAWLLWTDVQAVAINAAFAFPLVSTYAAHGAELVVSGKRAGVLAGNSRKFDASVLLVKNTAWARMFFRHAQQMLKRPQAMATVIAEDIQLHGKRNATLEQVLMYLLLSDEDGNQPKVYFEQSLCMACISDQFNVRAPTSYISLFPSMPCNSKSSLQQDSSEHEGFVNHTNLARCNFMKALHRAAPLEVAHTPLPMHFDAIRLTDWVMVPGRKNLRRDAAACRAACAEDPGCTAWLWCARPGGCDDGQEVVARLRPHLACDLLDAPAMAPLTEASRGPLFSSFAMGFMHDYVQPRPESTAAVATGSGIGGGKAPQGGTRGSGQALRQRGRRRNGSAGATGSAAGAAEAQSTRAVALPFWERQVAAGHRRRVPQAGHVNVAIVTAIPPNPCRHPIADHFFGLGVSNKVDYARRHDWEVHLSAENVDSTAVGNFNKMAFIRQVLAATPRGDAEWVWWADADTLVTDQGFAVPFQERYKGHDLVVWGQKQRVAAGDMEGINCGVMLFRNTDWSRAFLDQLYEYAHLGEEALQQMHSVLEQEVRPLVGGFKDTPFIVYLLKTQSWRGQKYIERVFFEDQIGINRHWLQVGWDQGETPLLVHYAGCSTCSPPEDKLTQQVELACTNEYAKAYAFARCNLAAAYQNISWTDMCRYPAANLSSITIRLGE